MSVTTGLRAPAVRGVTAPARRKKGIPRLLGMIMAMLVYITPVFLVVSNSLKPTSDIIGHPLGLPKRVTLENYSTAIEKMSFLGSLINTVSIIVPSVLLVCVFGASAAYFFTRVRWAPNQFTFYLMIVSMMVPFQVLMIPMIKILGDLNLLQQNWIIVYVYFASGVPLAVFMYSGFIRSIPRELDEAAALDGCSRVRIFFHVIFPLLRPVTLTIVVLNVLWMWNDFLMPFLVLRRPEQRTLTLSTLAFVQSHTNNYGPMMAALILTVIPVFLIYLFAQRHIIEGMVRGAVK